MRVDGIEVTFITIFWKIHRGYYILNICTYAPYFVETPRHKYFFQDSLGPELQYIFYKFFNIF